MLPDLGTAFSNIDTFTIHLLLIKSYIERDMRDNIGLPIFILLVLRETLRRMNEFLS